MKGYLINYKQISLLLLIYNLSFNLEATTLRNVEPIEVIEKSDRVAHVQVLEAKVVEFETNEDEIDIPSCGTNVRARILYDYIENEEKFVEFSIADSIEVGTEYLIFLRKEDSKDWYSGQWGPPMILVDESGEPIDESEGIDDSTSNCLNQIHSLKADSFPQRAIKIDYDDYLVFELNNMLIPEEVRIKTLGEGSIIQQYNQTLVNFNDFHDYLKKLIKSSK
ncbi:hypothetical protein E2K93_05135 [Thalassotalea sp. HSM 43]|uniref:hypothetical protein n=1 Tax=Thalassotalea sp. HSM 43 TaxID=2552945 RepID=UPI0010807631|nr:hypothetical protein [Thalassotalea sp. HSM 43]QBY03802.1 hypothetical protein E2K93_05135 [Thalassotalea sp. HSM 43]